MEPWTSRGVQARCHRFRDTAEARSLATAEELDAIWPGGAQNALKGHGAWIYCYGQLVRILDRREQRDPDNEEGQRLLAKVLRGVPIRVELVQPLDAREAVWVYPKAYDALTVLAECERLRRECRLWRDGLDRVPEAPQVREARAVVTRTLARLRATVAWILTHPGPGVPYTDHFTMPWDLDEVPPPWCWQLDPHDHLRIDQAHIRVNLGRLRALPTVEAATGGGGWATFFVSLAEQVRRPPEELMATRPLAGLIAQSAIAADTYRRAQRRAQAAAQTAPTPTAVRV